MPSDGPKRKAIPASIKRLIREQQGGLCGCRAKCGKELPPDGLGLVQYQHDSPLATRPIRPDGLDWEPGQHDPDYLYAELKECHARETNEGRSGATTLGSDKHAIAKIKRLLGEIKGRPKKDWPKRKIQSRPFPKSGA